MAHGKRAHIKANKKDLTSKRPGGKYYPPKTTFTKRRTRRLERKLAALQILTFAQEVADSNGSDT